MGCALADFNHATMVNDNKSLANYMRCIIALTLGVFLQKSLQDQKRWMRRFLKKPRNMLLQDYIARMIKINNYLKDSCQTSQAEIPPIYQTTNY